MAGGDQSPNSALKKSAKNRYFWSKNSIFSPFCSIILFSFGPFKAIAISNIFAQISILVPASSVFSELREIAKDIAYIAVYIDPLVLVVDTLSAYIVPCF